MDNQQQQSPLRRINLANADKLRRVAGVVVRARQNSQQEIAELPVLLVQQTAGKKTHPTGLYRSCRTNARWHFQFRTVPIGTYQLVVQPSTGKVVTKAVTILDESDRDAVGGFTKAKKKKYLFTIEIK